MELVPAGVELSFEVTMPSDDLAVGMVVYDDTGDDPVLVDGPIEMELVYGNTYRAKFEPEGSKSYIIVKSVYTDGTLTTLDSNYLAGSESIYAQNFNSSGGGGSSCAVVGIVEADEPIVGVVVC